MAKFEEGDLVRVRGHNVLEESCVCIVVENEYGLVVVKDNTSMLQYSAHEDDVDLVQTAEDVVNMVENRITPKFKDGDRVRYRGVTYYIAENHHDTTPDGDIIISLITSDEDGLYVPQNECHLAPLPEIPWEDVQDIVAAKYAELWQQLRNVDATGRCEMRLTCEGYLSSNEPMFKAEVYISSGSTIESDDLLKSFDCASKRFFENKTLKPKMLPKK